MKRLTWVDEDGTVLFQKANQMPEDLAFTITELAKNEDYDFLDSGNDGVDDVPAWQPMPEPYKTQNICNGCFGAANGDCDSCPKR